jgi:Fe-Mn family superoxide dismutase
MTFQLPELPYAADALEPVISAETIEYHYGKHHQAYVDKLNGMVEEETSLEEIIANSDGALFNNAAQVWNHTFYWHCMTPGGSAASSGELLTAIDHAFGSMDGLREAFLSAAAGNFGSGWTWLVVGANGGLEVINTDDADTPIARGIKPLLTVDVWEHAYYIDYRNARPKYLDAWWDIVDWAFVEAQFEQVRQAA